MMRWFGPGETYLQRTPTPVGEPCGWCSEPIASSDTGVTITHFGDEGPREIPYHYECNARMFIGSVAHIQRRCSCYIKGATCTDPPEMPLRQAARQALDLFRTGARNLK